jgi:hypothetical protein
MPKSDTQDHLIALKAQFDRHAAEAADENLEAVRAELEHKLALAEPPDSATLLGYLRDWEARLMADHPLAAGLLTDTIIKLESLGL